MDTLYLNNYKGFQDQLIELTDINFFVGENSSGKTSVLQIITLLSSKDFWNNFEFNTPEVELGYFDEIITKNCNESYFQIGMEKNNKNSDLTRFLLEFHKEDNTPRIKSLQAQFTDFSIYVKFTNDDVKYTISKQKKRSFIEWIKKNDINSQELSSFPFGINTIPMPLLILLILNESEKKEEKKEKIKNVASIDFILYSQFTAIAPIRAKPKRIYETYKINYSPEGDHIPLILKQLLKNKKTKKNAILNTLIQFGKESSLFDEIDVKEFSKDANSPFEILIKYKNTEVKLPYVGYGVSQVLPIIVEVLASNKKMFSIQQPEVHLHPKAQAAFGSFLYNSVKTDQNKFLIETHSDFTINRFRYELSKSKEVNSFKTQVLYFERTEHGIKINQLKINSNGDYDNIIPDNYRSFFIDEELKLLEI